MRAVVQLVKQASVRVDNQEIGRIGAGLVVFLGVHQDDTVKDAGHLAEKIVNLRIFPDEDQLMNRSVLDTGGEVLAVSQFTLLGDCRKGRRPGYSAAAPPDQAKALYEFFIEAVRRFDVPVATGEFQAMMEVALVNNGPVTLLLDTTRLF